MRRKVAYPLISGLAAITVAILWFGNPVPGISQQPRYPLIEKAAHKAYVEKVKDQKSFDMLPIPGGTYLMGSPDGEKGRQPDEWPQHPVTVKSFWMSKLEVRWDEYDWFWTKRFPMGQPPQRPDTSKKPDKLSDAVTSPTPPYADPTFGHGRDGNPCLAISHHAAMEYCRWLSKETGKHYRLPTEAEWEWACRAGTTTAYSFGDDPEKLGDYAWIEKNSDEQAHKVGKKQPNPWGLFDMHGNVAEWCVDLYRKDYYASLPRDKAVLNPFLAPIDKRYGYVARGGAWTDPPEKCRSAARRFSEKDWLRRDPQNPKSIWWMTEADNVGFRVVRAVEEDPRLVNIRSKVDWWSPD
jgi:formylglycine-generating enzyme required for sulfatase activity